MCQPGGVKETLPLSPAMTAEVGKLRGGVSGPDRMAHTMRSRERRASVGRSRRSPTAGSIKTASGLSRVVLCFTLIFSVLFFKTEAIAQTWSSGTNWNTGTNWSTGTVPTTTATFAGGGTPTVTFGASPATIGQILFTGGTAYTITSSDNPPVGTTIAGSTYPGPGGLGYMANPPMPYVVPPTVSPTPPTTPSLTITGVGVVNNSTVQQTFMNPFIATGEPVLAYQSVPPGRVSMVRSSSRGAPPSAATCVS
jgi:hypothetical protein